MTQGGVLTISPEAITKALFINKPVYPRQVWIRYSSVKWAREFVKCTNTKYKKSCLMKCNQSYQNRNCRLHHCLCVDFYWEQQCWLNWASHSLGFGEGIFLLVLLLLFPPRCFCPVCCTRGFCLLFYCSDSGLWLYLGWNRLPEHSSSKPGKPIFPNTDWIVQVAGSPFHVWLPTLFVGL